MATSTRDDDFTDQKHNQDEDPAEVGRPAGGVCSNADGHLRCAVAIVRRPIIVLIVSLIIIMSLVIATIPNLKVDTKPPKGRPAYALRDDIRTERLDSWIFARRDNVPSGNVTQGTLSVKSDVSALNIIYRAADRESNILTDEGIALIRQLEKNIQSMADYVHHCWKCPTDVEEARKVLGCFWVNLTVPNEYYIESSSVNGKSHNVQLQHIAPSGEVANTQQIFSCRPFNSVVRFFYPTNISRLAEILDNDQAQAAPVVAAVTNLTQPFPFVNDGRGDQREFENVTVLISSPEVFNPTNPSGSHFYMGSGFSATNLETPALRSEMRLGLPLEGYPNEGSESLKQEELHDKFMIDVVKKVIDPFRSANKDKIDISYSGGLGVQEALIDDLLLQDSSLSILSVLFVLTYLCFHTGSLFVGGFAMFHIVMSFPLAHFFLFSVLDIRYFDLLNMFLLFVIMGIGADDVFVFFDAWRQSELEPEDVSGSKEGRMSYTLRRSIKAMAVTSSTTSGAFIATSFSPLMPMKAFGIFAAIMVILNYVLVITMFPAVVMIWDRYLMKIPGFACCICARCDRCCHPARHRAAAQKEAKDNDIELAGVSQSPSAALTATSSVADVTKDDEELSRNGSRPRGRSLSTPWLEVHNVDSRSNVERWLFVHHAPAVLKNNRRYWILAAALVLVAVMSGLASQLERATTTPEFLPGEHVLTQYQRCSQNCFPIAGGSDAVELDLVWGINEVPDRQGHSIFDFGSTACNEGPCGTTVYDNTFNLNTPDAQQALVDICYAAAQNVSCVANSVFTSCFMLDFKQWREANGQSFPVLSISELHSSLRTFFNIQENRDKFVLNKMVYLRDDGTLIYASIAVKLQFQRGRFYTSGQVDPCYNEWVAWTNQQRSTLPNGVNNLFFTTNPNDGLFVLTEMSASFTTAAIQGVGLALALAAVILLIATHNLIVAATAFFWILCVAVVVFGWMYIFGWTVGVIEAICAALVVGFSVDYTVHFAVHYVDCEQPTRMARVAFVILEMGVSIFSGAITTFGASFFLLFTELTFFHQFGTFIAITVVFSLLIASLPFLASLAIIGPVGHTGDLYHYINRGKAYCTSAGSMRDKVKRKKQKKSNGASAWAVTGQEVVR